MAKSKKPNQAKPETVIYVGPNMGGDTPISQFTVFRNGLPLHISERIKTDKDFKNLFTPVGNLNAARLELKDPVSVKARAFNAVFKNRGVK